MRPTDTLYTAAQALEVYDYQPVQALQIIDSAVAVGNISPWMADYFKAKIYAWTVMGAQVDSLLPGSATVRFDSARVADERFLAHDSVRANLSRQQDVLEILVYAARHRQDTALFFRRAQELVDVCHKQGNETEALRTEAELGVALYQKGWREQGMARLDSVIAALDTRENRNFNALDAMIIARKRKMFLLSEEGKYIEAIPQARRIIERLDDYALHPDVYHDNSYREPTDSTARADYIGFYRTQAQSAITAAYAFLGEQSSMNDAYGQIEHSVREATAKEHIARYHALEQQLRRAEAEHHSDQMTLIASVAVVGLLLILAFAAYIYSQSRRIKMKNRALVKLIEGTASLGARAALPASITSDDVSSTSAGEAALPAGASPGTTEAEVEAPDAETARAEQELFARIDTAVRSERLYANGSIQRQDICNRFHIRRDVFNQLLSRHTAYHSFPNYINAIRLAEARRLLRNDASKTVNGIADEVGLSSRNFRRLFVEQYGMTPTEYRQGL